MQQLTAIFSATTNGHQLRVLADDHDGDLLDIPLDWDSFRPASAGHRLIEHGYMIRPDARTAEAVNGWREVQGQPDTWSVPVVPTGGAAQ
jgi:hypothetical protein